MAPPFSFLIPKAHVTTSTNLTTTAPPPVVAAAPAPTGHPPAFWFFFWGEFAERSSYYGMRVMLPLYMIQVLSMATTEATQIAYGFKMACYFLPLLGGIIADRWLGRYWTIVGFSVPYVAGHFVLGLPSTTALFVALALLAGGSGVIKPNISTLLGHTYDQLRPGQKQLRAAAFNWFYFSVNIGALISMFCLPLVRDYYIEAHLPAEVLEQAQEARAKGEAVSVLKLASPDLRQSAFALAFAVPAWLMVVSLGLFAGGKPFYASEKKEPAPPPTPEERRLQWKTLAQLFGVFALTLPYWFAYEQNDAMWIPFIEDYVNLTNPLTGKAVAADNLAFINALCVILLIPTFNFLFSLIDPAMKVITPMRKILTGFLLTAAAAGLMALAGQLARGADGTVTRVSILWPVAAYVVLTVGEVLVYGTMLELAYAAAPKSMKGFVTACFLVTSSMGSFLNILYSPLYGGSLSDEAAKRGSLMPGAFFGITALVVLAAALAFVFVGRSFEKSRAEAEAAGVT